MENNKPAILLIDDDQVYRFAATKTIEATGLAQSVDECNNGLDALNFLTHAIYSYSKLPDIIFLDINMPVMDGWEFLEAYRSIEPTLLKEIKIYIVSSSVDHNDILHSKEFIHVSGYVIKPVYKEKFTEILRASMS